MIIDTPAMVVDMAKVKRNIADCQKMADDMGLKLRPHIKTHKMPELARLQVAAGAVGITCASLSEAECMADAGIEDIFVAYPIIGKHKLERLLDLSERVRLITAVDGKAGAVALSDAAARRGVTAEVRLEIDTGMHRCGVTQDLAAELAVYVAALPHIELTGIFTFKSNIFEEKATADSFLAAREESALMALAARKIRAAGAHITDVSGGSTPTASFAGAESGLTEIRPGSYIFGDAQRIKAGDVEPQRCAAYVAVTVISTPAPNRAVVDGGSKAFAGDLAQDAPPFYVRGCGCILDRECKGIYPGLTFARMSEEHGVIESDGGGPTGLHVGQTLHIVPNHTCTSINLFDHVYIINEDASVRRERILARGMSY